MTLHKRLKIAGFNIAGVGSDLYVRDTILARAIITKHAMLYQGQLEFIEMELRGLRVLCVPGFYEPYWEQKINSESIQ